MALVFSGNCKARLIKWNHAFMVSHEVPFDLTVCIVKTVLLNNSARRKAFRDIEKDFNRIGLHPDIVFYFKNGADISTVWDSLNLKN
jgi:hypothetical protein